MEGGKEREREKGRTVVAQRKLSLNCCENRLSRVERQAVFWLDRSNVRLCAEHPVSINSSESFHSTGGQLGLTELTPCFPSSYNPSYPLFPSCQSVSPQIIPLTELSDYTDFSWPSTRPSVLRHFDTVSPSTSVTDWTMRHMTLVQTGDKNEIRHVIQCEGVRGNDCSSLHRHAHIRSIHIPTNANCKHMIDALPCNGTASPLLVVRTQFQPSHYQAPIKTEIWRKARARCCSAVAQIESDSLTHNMAPVMWLGQRGTLFLNSHIPKSEPHVQLRQTHSGSCL